MSEVVSNPVSDAAGRPRDAARTRERILRHARHAFARHGFVGTTVRGVADDAGVSPNLITRYFGGKDGLFAAAAEVRLGVDAMFEGPRESLGRRMADAIADRWTTGEGEDPLLVLLRSAGEHPEAATRLADLLDTESLEPLRRRFLEYGMGPEDADDRARAVDVFLVGVSARLRVLRDDLGPPDLLRDWLAASIQRLVDGR